MRPGMVLPSEHTKTKKDVFIIQKLQGCRVNVKLSIVSSFINYLVKGERSVRATPQGLTMDRRDDSAIS